jgi:hypothetical protein
MISAIEVSASAGPNAPNIAPPKSPVPSRSLAFAYDDARLLLPGQSKSSWLHVAGAPEKRELPLVVFLHGLNWMAQNHVWMGGGRADLRPIADRIATRSGAFAIAAPSQTKDAAMARTLWTEFDLAAFVESAVVAGREAGVRIDRGRVILVGHSGAGCSTDNGLFSAMSRDDDLPRAILAIDTCIDEEMGRGIARTQRLVWMTWQELEWPRDPTGAMRGFLEEVEPERVEYLRMDKLPVLGTDAHNSIVPIALERALPELLRL